MQTPPYDPNNPYAQRGFTAVPTGPAPAAPQQPYYDPNAGQIPVQQQVGLGMPPPYAPQSVPVQPQPPVQSEYQQDIYPQQQPAPFPQQQTPYQAPKTHNYNRVNIILGAVIGVMIIALGALAVSQLIAGGNSRTALVSAGNLGANYTGDAIIVRNESMYTQEGISQIEYIATEGAQVRRGDKVCTVFTSGFNTREWTRLNDFRNQIKEYQKTLLATTNIESDGQLKLLNSTVLSRAEETQAMVQSGNGNLLNQESLLSSDIEERSYYLKQKYADDQKLSRLYDDENTQLQRIETWTKPFAAGDTGLVSFYTDGFERVLNTLTYDSYSPSAVRSMYNGNLPAEAALGRNEVPVYRIVRQGSYSVLMLCHDTSWTPSVGATYELLVESFDNTNVSATVESVTRSEGELLLRLSVNADVANVLYIRSCHVQLSESLYSLTVPVNALTDSRGEVGVVVVQQDGNYFLPVNVVSKDAHEAHIIPKLNNILSVGSTVLLF